MPRPLRRSSGYLLHPRRTPSGPLDGTIPMTSETQKPSFSERIDKTLELEQEELNAHTHKHTRRHNKHTHAGALSFSPGVPALLLLLARGLLRFLPAAGGAKFRFFALPSSSYFSPSGTIRDEYPDFTRSRDATVFLIPFLGGNSGKLGRFPSHCTAQF